MIHLLAGQRRPVCAPDESELLGRRTVNRTARVAGQAVRWFGIGDPLSSQSLARIQNFMNKLQSSHLFISFCILSFVVKIVSFRYLFFEFPLTSAQT